MKAFKKIMMTALAVLPMLYTAAAVFFILPDTVAAHFNISGAVDRYGSKFEAFIFPAVILGVFIIYFVIRKIILASSTDDSARTERNLAVFDTVILLIGVLLNILCVFFLIIMKNPSVLTKAESLFFILLSSVIGVLFILIGNLMPKTRRNSFIGLRLSFTMDSDEHWYLANRNGGVALALAGIATIISGLIFRDITFVFVMILSLIVFLTVAILISYAKIKKTK